MLHDRCPGTRPLRMGRLDSARQHYESILEEWGIRHVPNTLVETGVCRPELLCELEAIAILPKDSSNGKPIAAKPK